MHTLWEYTGGTRRELNGLDSSLACGRPLTKGHSSRAAGVPGRHHEDSGSLCALWGVQRSTILGHDHGPPGLPWLWSPRHFNFLKSRGRLGAVVNLTALAYGLPIFREKANSPRSRRGDARAPRASQRTTPTVTAHHLSQRRCSSRELAGRALAWSWE